jgi:hypothetical protein
MMQTALMMITTTMMMLFSLGWQWDITMVMRVGHLIFDFAIAVVTKPTRSNDRHTNVGVLVTHFHQWPNFGGYLSMICTIPCRSKYLY